MLEETATSRGLCHQLGYLIASPEARMNCSGYLLSVPRAIFPWLRLSSGLLSSPTWSPMSSRSIRIRGRSNPECVGSGIRASIFGV